MAGRRWKWWLAIERGDGGVEAPWGMDESWSGDGVVLQGNPGVIGTGVQRRRVVTREEGNRESLSGSRRGWRNRLEQTKKKIQISPKPNTRTNTTCS